ncbi:MAG: hypothetical protein ACM3U2_13740 [Deltaproteobacteria bacterium]
MTRLFPNFGLPLLLLTCGASSAVAVDVRQAVWGFDGQVVAHRFNLFSVLVDNTAANPFEGKIELRKLTVGGQQIDAVLVEPVYLAPYSSRWVQFYPYIKDNPGMWEVSWGTGGANTMSPAAVRIGKPAVVLLDDPDAISESAGAIRRLAENLFPPHATATDCLAAVAVDHVPKWDPARQKSFLEWLKRGGRVYLLPNRDGKFPQFTGELQVLNLDVPRRRVESGLVHRLERTRQQLDTSFVELVIAAGVDPSGDPGADVPPPDPAKPADPAGQNANVLSDYGFFNVKWDPEATLLSNLKGMSRPDHSWVLIHFLSLVYLGLVCPGCIFVGRKYNGDFRITFGFLLATVLLFSLAFLAIGRRGYNESTVVHSVAIARQSAGDTLDVTQWSNAFVVRGGDYSFTHDGSGRIYSSCQEYEMVRGEIRNGPDAHFLADIPPCSSRTYSHRGLVPAPRIEVALEEWQTLQDPNPPAMTARSTTAAPVFRNDRALARLTLRKVRNFPQEYLDLYALYGRRLYRLKETADRLELSSDAGPLASLCRVNEYDEFRSLVNPRGSWQRLPFAPPEREPTMTDVFEAMFYPLLARSLDLADQLEVEAFSLPHDRVRLLIYAPLPPALFTRDARFEKQEGYVLYCLDVFEPEIR